MKTQRLNRRRLVGVAGTLGFASVLVGLFFLFAGVSATFETPDSPVPVYRSLEGVCGSVVGPEADPLNPGGGTQLRTAGLTEAMRVGVQDACDSKLETRRLISMVLIVVGLVVFLGAWRVYSRDESG